MEPQSIDLYPVLKSVFDPTLNRHIFTVSFCEDGEDITNE